MNPLLKPFNTPFFVPPFDSIKDEHYIPAIEQNIAIAKEEVEVIIKNEAVPSFENTIEALEDAGRLLGQTASVLFNLNSAKTNDNIQHAAMKAAPLLAAFNNEIKQNKSLFSKINTVYQQREILPLTQEQKTLLEKTYKSFIRAGAALDENKKRRFAEISQELSQLTVKFNENILAETNAFELVLEDPDNLSGLPDYVIEAAAESAKQSGHEGSWLFSLQAPSYIPFMQHSDQRALREKMYRAYMAKGSQGNEYDNKDNILKITSLRSEMASLLGYNTYADYVLEERMAGSSASVLSFLNDLLDRSLDKGKEEVEEIRAYMKSCGVDHEVQRWDWSYYSEKLKKEKYAIDDAILKPYFQLEKVLDGAFQVAKKLYGLSFHENKKLPVYHEDVRAFEVRDEKGKHVSVFLADFFPRQSKKGGAWMTSFLEQHRQGDKDIRPIVSIVCSFTPPTNSTPSLLTFDEANTLFHEFGHALHGMLSDVTYSSLASPSVFWDFVELPSQILENWLLEKECLDLFATHFKTGEKIPEDLIEKLIKANKFQQAYATTRQLSFGLLDMEWYSIPFDRWTSNPIQSVAGFEKKSFSKMELFPPVEGAMMSTQFSHIFAGGYGAGYYSYKWSEVLDADAFSLFKEKGIFNKETATDFKQHILSKGGTEHPMELYKRFRGKEPELEPLLERSGLKD